jgi:hypothetical protein
VTADAEDRSRRHDDESMPVVLHRLGELEHRVENGFKESAASMRNLDRKLDQLAFVRVDVYAAEKLALEQRLGVVEKKLEPDGEVAKDIADSRRPGMWALSVIGSAFLVALVGFLVQIALRGPS